MQSKRQCSVLQLRTINQPFNLPISQSIKTRLYSASGSEAQRLGPRRVFTFNIRFRFLNKLKSAADDTEIEAKGALLLKIKK